MCDQVKEFLTPGKESCVILTQGDLYLQNQSINNLKVRIPY